MPVVSAIFGFLSTFTKGLFGFKGEQAKVVENSLETLGKLNDTEAQAVVAQASAMASILNNASFLERNWRAVAMCLIMALIAAYFFGYAPPGIDKPMSPMMERLFNLFEIGLGGYIVRYGIRDIVREFQLAKIIKDLIAKKIV